MTVSTEPLLEKESHSGSPSAPKSGLVHLPNETVMYGLCLITIALLSLTVNVVGNAFKIVFVNIGLPRARVSAPAIEQSNYANYAQVAPQAPAPRGLTRGSDQYLMNGMGTNMFPSDRFHQYPASVVQQQAASQSGSPIQALDQLARIQQSSGQQDSSQQDSDSGNNRSTDDRQALEQQDPSQQDPSMQDDNRFYEKSNSGNQ